MQLRTRAVSKRPQFGGANCAHTSESQACGTTCCAGHYGAGNCTPCAEGKFQPLASASSCDSCAAGKYASVTGATSCTDCPSGRWGDASVALTHAGHCVQCPEGKFQVADGQSKCVKCESGKYINAAGSPQCLDCPAGQYTAGQAGQTSCKGIPTPCEVNDWGTWGACSKTCGGGHKTRQRTVKVYPSNGPYCPALEDTVLCNTELCPAACQVSEYGDFGECSATCGGGQKTKTRSIIQGPVGHSDSQDLSCPSQLVYTVQCNEQACPVDCEVDGWSAWSPCSVECGGGSQTRQRSIVHHRYTVH